MKKMAPKPKQKGKQAKTAKPGEKKSASGGKEKAALKSPLMVGSYTVRAQMVYNKG
jgi:hypothetical protein